MLLAGIFLGGAIDHAVLALRGSPVSPYQVRVGVAGNWALALLDLAVALAAILVALKRIRSTTSVTKGGAERA